MMKLEKGVALVITGDKGCGKSTLALAVAAQHGGHFEMRGDELARIGTAMRDYSIDILIVNEPAEWDWLTLKSIIASEQIAIQRNGVPAGHIPTPLIIITATTVPQSILESRRFNVCTISFNQQGEQP